MPYAALNVKKFFSHKEVLEKLPSRSYITLLLGSLHGDEVFQPSTPHCTDKQNNSLSLSHPH